MYLKKAVLSFVLILGIAVTVSAQKKKPITQDEVMTYELMDILSETTFYIDKVLLQREIQRDPNVDYKALIQSGKVSINGGKMYEIVDFSGDMGQDIPGQYEYKKGDVIGVRFEHGEDRVLEFKLTKAGNGTMQYYQLKTYKSGSKNMMSYAGHEWHILEGSYVYLQHKGEYDTKAKKNKTKVRGMKKDGSSIKGLLGK